MKLYFMKQSALDYMKANISHLYKNYYQFNTPDWIYELFDYDPFEVFDTVEDFDLASTKSRFTLIAIFSPIPSNRFRL